jgi:hypothetical protein
MDVYPIFYVSQLEPVCNDPLLGQVVPGEYHQYLHVFEAREDQGLPPHRHHDYHIPLLEGKTPPFEPIRALDENRLHALREYLEMNVEWG